VSDLPRPLPWERTTDWTKMASEPPPDPKVLEPMRKADREFSALSIRGLLAKEEQRLEEGARYVPTGWPRLDTALGGGLLIPSLTVLGSGPKAFKSTFAQIIATRHVEARGAVYYIDVENGRHRFLRRMLCRQAELGSQAVAAAMKDHRSGVFHSKEAVERWRKAKVWLSDILGGGLHVEFRPPKDLEGRVAAARRAAGDRPLLVVIDSLQKLASITDDRRAEIDRRVRLFERLRHDYDAAFLVVSEIKRDLRGGYTAHGSAFKESGGIEYAADLAMTLERPGADDDKEAPASLRIEFARDGDEDPRGDVASYRPIRPFLGLEEIDPVERRCKRRGPAAEKAEAARDFLAQRLNGAAVAKDELVKEAAEEKIACRSTLFTAAKAMKLVDVTVGLKPGWRMP
jgi:KaiC/GvpD/RAD55 family RecA-like ATPase